MPIKKTNHEAKKSKQYLKKGNGEAHAWPFLHLTVLNQKKKLVKA